MGGSGGGGGSAGEVSWPSTMTSSYNALIGVFGGASATTALASAVAGSPYTGATPYAPDSLIQEISNFIANWGNSLGVTNPFDMWNNIWNTADLRWDVAYGSGPTLTSPSPEASSAIQGIWVSIVNSLTAADNINSSWVVPTPTAITNIPQNWKDPTSTAPSDIASAWTDPSPDSPSDISTGLAAAATISDAVTAYGARLDDTISSDVLPRFQAGMRDINAVQSSAFVIGRAVIEGMRDRDVAMFDADLTTKLTAQKDQLIGQAYMQDDKILAANIDSENKAIGQAYLQNDKINADSVDGENKSLTQAYLDNDKILAGSVLDKNKALSQAFLQDDKIVGADSAEENKMRSQGLIQADKINADSDKAFSLIEAEMVKHGTTMLYNDNATFWNVMHGHQGMYGDLTAAVIDSNRIKYVMKKEERDMGYQYDAMDDRWDLDMVQIAGNLVASISGGTSYTPGPSNAQNALGGAFAGASIGARASGGSAMGTAGGAILGGIGAYLMGR